MLKNFFKQCLYIQLSPQRVLVRDAKSGRAVDEVPEIAIHRPPGGKLTVAAVGREASAAAALPDTTLHNPFAHPRSLVSDFTLAQQVLKAFVRRAVGNKRTFIPSPVIVIHPLGEHAGGLTQVELRAFHELARGVGAQRARVWLGPALTDEQLLSDRLPDSGRIVSA